MAENDKNLKNKKKKVAPVKSIVEVKKTVSKEKEATKPVVKKKTTSASSKKKVEPVKKTVSKEKETIKPVVKKKTTSTSSKKKTEPVKKSVSKEKETKPAVEKKDVVTNKKVESKKSASNEKETKPVVKTKKVQPVNSKISKVKETKPVEKKDTVTNKKVKSKKSVSKEKETKPVVKTKKVEPVNNKVSKVKETKPVVEKKTSAVEKKSDKVRKINGLIKLRNRFNKLINNNKISKKTPKVRSTMANKSKVSEKKNISNKNIFGYIKTRKWVIGIIICCVVILLIEGIYLLIYKPGSKNTYYESHNAIVLDKTDIIVVGSGDFKYSKENDYTKGLEKGKIVKYDKTGKIIFEKIYENGINTTFSSVIVVSDGYIVVGSGEFSTEEQEAGAREAFIIKYDFDGKLLWEKFYQVVTNTRFHKVIEVSDGYVAVGQSIYGNMEMGNHTTGGGIIVKYDFDGNVIWKNNHGGMKSGSFNGIVEVNDDLYVVGKDATDSGNIIKFDKDGKYKWHKNYSYTDSLGLSDIKYLNGYLYAIGSKKVLPEGVTDEDERDTTNTDTLLLQYDLDGNLKFEKTFGGSGYERFNSLLVYGKTLIAVGHITSDDSGLKVSADGDKMTGLLIRYDRNGNILKRVTYGGSNNDNLTSIVTDNNSLYIVGYSNSKDGNIKTSKNNGKDYFGKLIKLDSKFRVFFTK